MSRFARVDRRAVELVGVLAVLALAAVMRFPGLETRGPWDTDQGEQMLAIRDIALGNLTLLGPPTSTGGLHHGTVFYYLGAIFAFPSGGDDPTAVTFGIALGGMVAVLCAWWLARAAGGPVAGLVAALLAAVAAQQVDASIRLWNPAFVAPAAALALAAAVEAWRRRDPRWWVVAAIGVVLAGQSHVLAWIIVVPVAVLGLATLPRTGRRAAAWAAVAIALVALSFVPLAVNELTTGFSEVQRLLEARGGQTDDGPSTWVRLFFVPMRILGVAIFGDIGRSLMLLPVGTAAVIGAAVIAIRSRSKSVAAGDTAVPGGADRPGTTRATPNRVTDEAVAPRAALLLSIGLAIGCLGLAIGAPWLSTVTPLYVDHYHLALDPIVYALLGLGAAVLLRQRIGRLVAAVGIAGIVAWNLLVVPLPLVNPDGGWPAGLAAGERVVSSTGGRPTAIVGVPKFKKTMAVDYPVTILGRPPADAAAATRVAVLCDQLFEEIVGSACLGPAEAERLTEVAIEPGALLDRFEAAPGRWISIYEIAGR